MSVAIAVAFVIGLALGYSLGVAAYLTTFALYQKWNEDRTVRRINQASQIATRKAIDLANIRAKARSLYGDRLDASQEIDEEVERALIGKEVRNPNL